MSEERREDRRRPAYVEDITDLRNKLSADVDGIYNHIRAEKQAVLDEVHRLTAGPPFWQGAARLLLYGVTLLGLSWGVGALVLKGYLPDGTWDRIWSVIDNAGRLEEVAP